jgi:hydroxymethylpyrimidine pyrophosphatase-like HAD family hydrolase
VKVLYTDLDGTMVGPYGCFFRDEGGELTLEPTRALLELHEAGVALVLVSGRTQAQLLEVSAVFGADGFIAELGALVAWGRVSSMTVQQLPGTGDPASEELVAELGDRFGLRVYEPWHEGHVVDVLMRGVVDVGEVETWLRSVAGAEHLRLRDNGVLRTKERVYHLIPDGVSKGAAVEYDLQRRGFSPADAVAVGDSESDVDMARAVGTFWLTANGARHMPVIPEGVQVTRQPVGAGWAEAVRAGLAAG